MFAKDNKGVFQGNAGKLFSPGQHIDFLQKQLA